MTPNIHYQDRDIEGERLDFPKDAICWVGPNVTFRRCTLVFSTPARWLHLLSGRLLDCTLQAKSELKTLSWSAMKLKGCQFKGHFGGNDFGPREDLDERWRLGEIEDCDFSAARLNGCRFFNCDMRTIQLPRWPCFTFMNPRVLVAGLGHEEKSGPLGLLLEGLAKNPDGTQAETWHAPTVARKLDTTVEELRAALERLPGIVL